MSIESPILSPAFNADWQAFIQGNENIKQSSFLALREAHGAENADNAAVNLLMEIIGEDMKAHYAESPLADEINEMVDHQLEENKLPTTVEAQDDIDDAYRDLLKMYAEGRTEALSEELMAGPNGASDEKKSGSGKGELGAGHWLVMLAKAMGGAAGEHLKQAVLLGEKIAGVTGTDDQAGDAKLMAEYQAQLQAHTQMFKMAYEATTTLLKTTGEAMSTMARKQ